MLAIETEISVTNIAQEIAKEADLKLCIQRKVGSCVPCRLSTACDRIRKASLSEREDDVLAELNRICCQPRGGEMTLSREMRRWVW